MTMPTKSAPTLRTFLREEPFTLAMSSGFFGFFAHAGVLSILEEAGLLPAHLCGSSAGALVAGAWASGLDAHVLRDELFRLERAHVWDPSPGFGLLRGALFREKLEALLPVSNFDDVRMSVALSVFDLRARRTRVIDRGPLAAAIHASCAVPFMFHPVVLDGAPCVDGGVADRPGIAGAPEAGRVLYHHLASRSPWRFTVPRPRRTDTTTMIIDDLPRVGPFRLHQGRLAFERAARATRRALDAPHEGTIVCA
jgi:NTE family protein